MRKQNGEITVAQGTAAGNFLEALDSVYSAVLDTAKYQQVLAKLEGFTSELHLIADTARDEQSEGSPA